MHGAQPIEAYPRSYSGLWGSSCSFRYDHVSRRVHVATGFTFTIQLPGSSSYRSTIGAVARVGDESRRNAVTHASRPRSAASIGSHLVDVAAPLRIALVQAGTERLALRRRRVLAGELDHVQVQELGQPRA